MFNNPSNQTGCSASEGLRAQTACSGQTGPGLKRILWRFKADGLCQRGGDRLGRRGSRPRRGFLFILTYLQPRSIGYIFALSLFLTSLLPNVVFFLWAWGKLFTFAGWDYFCWVEWMMLFFVSEWVRRKCCRLRNNVPCSPTHLERLVLAAKAEENHVHFLSRKLVKVH